MVSRERSLEAQGWARLSRVLTEYLPDLDYLDKGAQVSLFCIGDRSSRYYLNLQSVQKTSRLEILKHCNALELYNKLYPLSENEDLSLGGLGIEILPQGFRTKLYVRGRLATLIEETKGFIVDGGMYLSQLDSHGFIRAGMGRVGCRNSSVGGFEDKVGLLC